MVNSARALGVKFMVYDDKLERVKVLKYLSQLLSMDNNDVQTIRANLKKARTCWNMVPWLLRAENMPA